MTKHYAGISIFLSDTKCSEKMKLYTSIEFSANILMTKNCLLEEEEKKNLSGKTRFRKNGDHIVFHMWPCHLSTFCYLPHGKVCESMLKILQA